MPRKVIQISEICRKCHKTINPEEERAYDENNNRVCLDCFFEPLNEARENGTVMCEVKELILCQQVDHLSIIQ